LEVRLAKELINDGDGGFSLGFLVQSRHFACIIGCGHSPRSYIFGVDEFINGHAGPLRGVRVAVARFLVLLFVLDVLLGLNLRGWRHV
jgi:hypothetical protein